MHQQIRMKIPASSPPNVAAALAVISDAGINIRAVGGSNHERGGEFAFATAHTDMARAKELLEGANPGYHPRIVKVEVCFLVADQAGQLHTCVQNAKAKNPGKQIRDIAIGIPEDDGSIPVQLFFD